MSLKELCTVSFGMIVSLISVINDLVSWPVRYFGCLILLGGYVNICRLQELLVKAIQFRKEI